MPDSPRPETTLPDRERFLEALLESAIDYGIIAMDLDGLVTSWNEGAHRILGWTEAEIIGRPASVFFTPEDRRSGIPQAEMQAALHLGRGSDERWHEKKDGSRFWANGEMMPLRDDTGTVQGFIKILRDRTAQRIAAEKQRADAEFLRSILTSSGDCIKVLDLDTNITFMNDGGLRVMEVGDFKSVRGLSWQSFWQGQSRIDADAAVAAAKAGKAGRFKGPSETMAGTPKWWDVQVTPICGADGQPEKLLSVSRDITAVRRAEDALREVQGLNTLILNSSRDCIVVLDLNGLTQFVSPGGIESMEISDVDAILGLSWLRVWHGADHEAAYAAVAKAREGGVGRFQGFCPTHTGKPKWWDVVISPLPGPDGRPDRLVSVGRDISEFKETQQQLVRSQERLNLALVASGMIGIWDWDLKANIVYADTNFARLYGIDPAQAAKGVSFAEYTKNFHPADLPAFQAELARVLAGADEFSCEYRIVQADRSLRWVSARGRPVRDEAGAPLRFPGASVDITESKQAEERQRLLMQELAHRVKNTLAVVQGLFSQTIRSKGNLEDVREAFSARLLALAQAHDVLMQGSWTEAGIRPLVEGAARLLGQGDLGRFRIEGPDVTLGPRAALSFALILHELGTNAVKYGALSAQQGSVAVVWRLDDMEGEVHLRFRWQESDGPAVVAPTRQGFGSRLIERTLAQGLGATVLLAYPQTGVTLTLDAPLAAVQQI